VSLLTSTKRQSESYFKYIFTLFLLLFHTRDLFSSTECDTPNCRKVLVLDKLLIDIKRVAFDMQNMKLRLKDTKSSKKEEKNF